MNRRPPGYESANVNAIDPAALAALRRAQREQQWPLLLAGPTGTGKTNAAAVLYGTWHRLPMWHRADDLLLAVSMGRRDGVQVDGLNKFGETVRRTIDFKDFVNRVISASCLFLDDLAVRDPTDQMRASLFDLLEWRLHKPVVITTNKGLDEIAELFDDRIASRLSSGTLVLFSGDDRRSRSQPVRVPERSLF